MLARRLTDFLSRNSYIDTTVQKGGISGVPGFLDHTGVVTQLIREARENIPHKLVQTTLERHHMPGQVAELIMDYYDQFNMRVSSGPLTSK